MKPTDDKRVSIPVRRVGNKWEYFYGGDVPVREGTPGELKVDLAAITDERFSQRLTAEVSIKILGEGAKLLVALSDPKAPPHTPSIPKGISALDLPAGTTRMETVVIGPEKPVPAAQADGPPKPEAGGLWLVFKGLNKTEIRGSTIRLPEVAGHKVAISLNHAYTVLSELIETQRISHTGNIYTKVFYREESGRWYPIDDLRWGAQGEVEQKLLRQAWEDLEKQLGWRPALNPPAKRTKKGTGDGRK
jgi:hypothetical protein